VRLNESRVFHHVGELVRSTSSDWISRHSSLSSRILGEAKATGAAAVFSLDERETAIEGMILVDLRTEVGSKKTGPDPVSLVAGTWGNLSYHVSRALLQYDTMSVIVEAFRLPSNATRFGLYRFNCSMTYADGVVSTVK
jgi:hypothetical protein